MDDKLEMLALIKEISISIGNLGTEIKHIRTDKTDIKRQLEKLTSNFSIHYNDIEELKRRTKANEENIEKLKLNQKLLQLSTDRFDKLDNNLNRTKRFISYVTFNNNIMRNIVKGVFTAFLFGIVILFFSMIIDYISLKFGLDVDTTAKLKDSLNK